MEYVEKLAKLGRKVEASGVVPVGTGAGGSGEVKAWDMVLKELNGVGTSREKGSARDRTVVDDGSHLPRPVHYIPRLRTHSRAILCRRSET
jgi:hypothetical protein